MLYFEYRYWPQNGNFAVFHKFVQISSFSQICAISSFSQICANQSLAVGHKQLILYLIFKYDFLAEALKAHKAKRHSVFYCSKCPEHKGFNRKSSLNTHIRVMHNGIIPTTSCQLCHKILKTEEKAISHFNKYHKQSNDWELHNHALKKHVQVINPF